MHTHVQKLLLNENLFLLETHEFYYIRALHTYILGCHLFTTCLYFAVFLWKIFTHFCVSRKIRYLLFLCEMPFSFPQYARTRGMRSLCTAKLVLSGGFWNYSKFFLPSPGDNRAENERSPEVARVACKMVGTDKSCSSREKGSIFIGHDPRRSTQSR